MRKALGEVSGWAGEGRGIGRGDLGIALCMDEGADESGAGSGA